MGQQEESWIPAVVMDTYSGVVTFSIDVAENSTGIPGPAKAKVVIGVGSTVVGSVPVICNHPLKARNLKRFNVAHTVADQSANLNVCQWVALGAAPCGERSGGNAKALRDLLRFEQGFVDLLCVCHSYPHVDYL